MSRYDCISIYTIVHCNCIPTNALENAWKEVATAMGKTVGKVKYDWKSVKRQICQGTQKVEGSMQKWCRAVEFRLSTPNVQRADTPSSHPPTATTPTSSASRGGKRKRKSIRPNMDPCETALPDRLQEIRQEIERATERERERVEERKRERERVEERKRERERVEARERERERERVEER